MLASGSITMDALYWHEGMSEWAPITQFPKSEAAAVTPEPVDPYATMQAGPAPGAPAPAPAQQEATGGSAKVAQDAEVPQSSAKKLKPEKQAPKQSQQVAPKLPNQPKQQGGKGEMGKEAYLDKLREKSSYPQFRLGVMAIVVLMYLGVAVYTVIFVMVIFKSSVVTGLLGLLVCAILAFLVIPFYMQALLMLADLVDTTLEKNSRN